MVILEKKVIKKPEIKVNAKQKAITKNKTTLAQRRAKKKQIKKNKLLKNRKKSRPIKKITKPGKSQLYTLEEVIKNYCYSKDPGLTIAISIERAKEIQKELNSSKRAVKKEKKVYTPSMQAKRHHKYVEACIKENKLKREAYALKQRHKKHIRHSNRLVCIRKENTIARVLQSLATTMVASENWAFIPKQEWKNARAEKSSNITLLWTVGKLTLPGSPQNMDKSFARFKRNDRKKKRQKEEALIKAVKARAKRKKRIIKVIGTANHPKLIMVKTLTIGDKAPIIEQIKSKKKQKNIRFRKKYTASYSNHQRAKNIFNAKQIELNIPF